MRFRLGVRGAQLSPAHYSVRNSGSTSGANNAMARRVSCINDGAIRNRLLAFNIEIGGRRDAVAYPVNQNFSETVAFQVAIWLRGRTR